MGQHDLDPTTVPPAPSVDDLVFVAFNSQVLALNRNDGEVTWQWSSPRRGHPILLLDGDRLIVSVNGYTSCLDPCTGEILWKNDLPGTGVGIPSLASARGGSITAFMHLVAQKQAADTDG